MKRPDGSLPVLIDGPYGGVNMQVLTETERLLVVAGGSGSGWTLPFIELALLKRQRFMLSKGERGRSIEPDEKQLESGIPSLRIILATRDTSSRIWFLRAVGELLSRYSAHYPSSNINVQVYLTGEADQTADSSKIVADVTIESDFGSSSENINVKPEDQKAISIPGKELCGRPGLPLIIAEESAHAAELGQSLGVFTCGPTSMQNDVRNAVAEENLKLLAGKRSGEVYLHLEHFSWA